MTGMDKKIHWLDQPRNIKLLWRGFLVVLALLVLAEFLVEPHPYFAIQSIFGFNAWFGLLACAAVIGVVKALSLLLKRSDNYYGQGDD
jgi:hypothetical protein